MTSLWVTFGSDCWYSVGKLGVVHSTSELNHQG